MTNTLEALGLTSADLTIRPASTGRDGQQPWDTCWKCEIRTNRFTSVDVFAGREDELYKVWCPRHARAMVARGELSYVPSNYR